MQQAKAEEFFRQLEAFSADYLCMFGLPKKSPWGGEAWKEGAPQGAIIHYTADLTIEQSLRWFCTEKYQAKASAHVVVAERRMPSVDRLLTHYPLVAELPVTVVQTRGPRETAWHATWTNATCYGIENVNAGELRKDAVTGKLMHWRPRKAGEPEWTSIWSGLLKPTPVESAGRVWDVYPSAQVSANIVLLRYVNALFGGTLQAARILGHEQVQGVETHTAGGEPMKTQKRDPGPLFPLDDVRRSVLSADPRSLAWLEQYEAAPGYCDRLRESAVQDVVAAMAGQRPSAEVAWQRFDAAIRALPDRSAFGLVGKLALYLLGYHVHGLLEPVLHAEDVVGVQAFQRLMGLKVDGEPGRLTKQALVRRLVDRGVLRAP